MAELIF